MIDSIGRLGFKRARPDFLHLWLHPPRARYTLGNYSRITSEVRAAFESRTKRGRILPLKYADPEIARRSEVQTYRH